MTSKDITTMAKLYNVSISVFCETVFLSILETLEYKYRDEL